MGVDESRDLHMHELFWHTPFVGSAPEQSAIDAVRQMDGSAGGTHGAHGKRAGERVLGSELAA